MKSIRKALLAAAVTVILVGSAYADDSAADGTITFAGGTIGAGVGISFGKGVLHYQDKDYPFTVQGLSVADVGVASVDGVGEVYDLSNVGDFAGTYAAAGMGATLAGGGSVAALENEHGVIIHFHSTAVGLKLNLSGSGIHVALN